VEGLQYCPTLHIPQRYRRISRASKNLQSFKNTKRLPFFSLFPRAILRQKVAQHTHLVIGAGEEAAGGVGGVRAHHLLPGRAVVLQGEGEYGELVIQAAARHRLPAGRVGAAHHPSGGQGQSVLLVSRVGVL
jgi:hypothetical protein